MLELGAMLWLLSSCGANTIFSRGQTFLQNTRVCYTTKRSWDVTGGGGWGAVGFGSGLGWGRLL